MWTKKEEEKLIQLYPTFKNSELSIIFNRTISSIINKSNSLGLRKSKSHISGIISRRNKEINRDLSYEFIKREAMKYRTRSEFQRFDCSSYVTARKMGILDEVCSHMNKCNFSVPQLMLKILIENLMLEDIRYDDRKTIAPYEIDIFLPKFNLAFEYDGKRWHRNNKNDVIKNEIMNNKNIKFFRFLENNRNYESDIKEQFKSILPELNEYTGKKINYADVDSIDLSSAYTYSFSDDHIKNVCSKYTKFKDFRENEPRLYTHLVKSKKLSDYTKDMLKRITWSDDLAINEIKQHKSLSDFIRLSYGCYQWVKKNKKEHLLNNLFN